MGYIYLDTAARPDPAYKFTRFSGKTRFETNIDTIKHFPSWYSEIVVVKDTAVADAASAAYLAKMAKCPIVFDKNIDQYKDRVETIYIIGGSVPDPKTKARIIRISGNDRFETNLAVLKYVKTPNKQLLIVDGASLADMVLAASIDRSIMFINKSITSEQIAYIKERRFTECYLIGGVKDNVKIELSKYTNTYSFSGKNRYETSYIIGDKFFNNANNIIIVEGNDYYDGISALNIGTYPIVYCNKNNIDYARKYISPRKLKNVYVSGGTGVLPDEIVNWCLTKE